MLALNEAQWQALLAADARQFVAAACDELLAVRPDLIDSPGRADVLARMQAAQSYALHIGITSTPHVLRLMHLAADAPGFFRDPAVDAHLRKPGATAEQRLDDLLAVMHHKLKEADTWPQPPFR